MWLFFNYIPLNTHLYPIYTHLTPIYTLYTSKFEHIYFRFFNKFSHTLVPYTLVYLNLNLNFENSLYVF